MSQRTFYKFTYTVEVLSEKDNPPDALDEIHYQITEGHMSGVIKKIDVGPVSGMEMAALLYDQGSDTEFFRIDGSGNDICWSCESPLKDEDEECPECGEEDPRCFEKRGKEE